MPASACAALRTILVLRLHEARLRDLDVHREAVETVERVRVIGEAWATRNSADVVRDVAIVDDETSDAFEWVSVAQARQTLGVSAQSVTARLRRRSLHGRKDGGIWRVCVEDLSARTNGSQCRH